MIFTSTQVIYTTVLIYTAYNELHRLAQVWSTAMYNGFGDIKLGSYKSLIAVTFPISIYFVILLSIICQVIMEGKSDLYKNFNLFDLYFNHILCIFVPETNPVLQYF